MSSLTAVRAPSVARVLSISLVARIPDAVMGLLLVLQARHLGFSYAIGGLSSGATAVGMAIGGPLLGRIADHRGQRLVLQLSGLVSALCLAATTEVPRGAAWLLVLLSLGCGFALPPVAACVRAIWSHALEPGRRERILTLDASLQEVAFMVGPLLLASAASIAGVHFAIVATAAILWGGTSAFALTPEVQATTKEPGEVERTTGAGALRSAGVRTLLCVSVALGIAFGATEIGIVAFAGGHHANGTLGLLYAAWSISSLAAGLWTARRVRLGDPVRRVVLLLLAMAGGSALLTIAPSVPGLAVGLLIAGAPVAPLFAVAYQLMGAVAPEGTVTEAYAWETTGIMAGLAVGNAAAGVLGTTPLMFAVAAVALVGGALLVVVQRDTLPRAPRPVG